MDERKERFEEIKEEIEDEKSEAIAKIIGQVVMGGFIAGLTFSFGISAGYFAKRMEILTRLLSSLVLTVTTGMSIGKGIEIKYNNMELNHLNKIESEGIKKNERLDNKRENKIRDLKELQKKKKIKSIIMKVLEVIAGTLCVVGGVGSLLTSNLLAPAIISLCAYAGISIKDLFEKKDICKYQVRINNLENDLYLGEYYGYNPDAKSEVQKKKIKINSQEETQKEKRMGLDRSTAVAESKEKAKVKIKRI